MSETRYVLGFAFSPDWSEVALIRKDHPEWQRGLLNGIGGKIEPEDQRVADAMTREFHEEAGLWIDHWTWQRIATMKGTDAEGWSWDVAVFQCRTHRIDQVESQTSETVKVYPTEIVPRLSVVHNLRWLVPFAADPNRPYVVADYTGSENAAKAASQDRKHHEVEGRR